MIQKQIPLWVLFMPFSLKWWSGEEEIGQDEVTFFFLKEKKNRFYLHIFYKQNKSDIFLPFSSSFCDNSRSLLFTTDLLF